MTLILSNLLTVRKWGIPGGLHFLRTFKIVIFFQCLLIYPKDYIVFISRY